MKSINSFESYDEILAGNIERAEFFANQASAFLLDTIKKKRPFGLYQPQKNIIVIVRPANTHKVEAALGFPFPVARKEINTNVMANGEAHAGEITVCFRGENLRQYQRHLLVGKLGFQLNLVTRKEIYSLVAENKELKTRCTYVNPYAFLGDSLIGLYFLERIKKHLGVDDHIIFSPSAEHQKFLGNIHQADDKSINFIDRNDIILLPDLIDNHLPNTLEWLERLSDLKCPVLIIGRGLYIDYSARTVYALDEEDPLLRNSNIQDYMDDCLEQFMEEEKAGTNEGFTISYPFSLSGSAFINPFASLGVRDLDAEFILNLVESIFARGVRDIHISNGVKTSDKDAALIEKLKELMKDRPYGVQYHWFDNLSGIADFVRKENIGMLFSPDTSVPHMFNAMGHPIFTIYKTNFWDPRSIQSMASDSPLGFCRYQPTQIPILSGPGVAEITSEMWDKVFSCFQKKVPVEGAKKWIESIDSMLSNPEMIPADSVSALESCAKEHEIEVLMEVFDLHYFLNILSGFSSEDISRLYRSLIRVSPVYKWMRLQTC